MWLSPLTGALAAWCARDARRFRRGLGDVEYAQSAVRRRLAQDLLVTDYARAHGISAGVIDDGARWRDEVPLCTWSDVAPYVDRELAGERRALCAERPRAFEPTSGSGGPRKMVPYPPGLRRSFARMFAVWCHDVLTHGPRLSSAKMYVMVSPPVEPTGAPRETEGGASIGLVDDAAYAGGWLAPFLRPFFVSPASGPGPDGFVARVARALGEAQDLEIISVWNPDFLLAVLDEMGAAGTPLREVWPALQLVSCWDAAFAAPSAERLRAQAGDPGAGGVRVQGKGLLATEGPVTVPLLELGESQGQVPLTTEVLIELLDEAGRPFWLHEAEVGARYEVVLSTAGGLSRYRLGDVVEVTGHLDAAPRLRLVGRADATVDLVGEKLSEPFVADVVRAVAPDARVRSLVPDTEGRPPRYVLVLDDGPGTPAALATALERGLSAAHHYARARALGQLGPAAVLVDEDADRRLLEAWTRSGRKAGDFKPGPLVRVPLEGLAAGAHEAEG